MTGEQEKTALLRKLVAAARAIVTYEVAIPLGCRRIVKLLYWSRAYIDIDSRVFDEYLNATTGLATAHDRLYWNRDALREQDIRLEAINREYRDRIFDACYEIVDTYAVKETDV